MIRRAGPADEVRLLTLIEEFYEVDGHELDPETVISALSPLLISDRYGMVIVAEEDEDLVGYAALTWGYSIESGGPDALLDEIYVREPGRGIGTGLMEEVFRTVRDRGIRRVFLETERANETARRFYESLGFEVEESVWMLAELPS